ncbi:50S ribosomal protein L25/general stress protein Ctc [Terrihabitans sp. B22-R8]|uniref:50S ribosomal protein L25/general stress protein Ctc n=1 Tax=Terrihabitans sp. B22-R8 TaxID=3425128 RepID=UPI00403D4CCC
MTATKVLKAEARDRVGKGAARAVRREHKVPAVIYGAKQTPVSISLNGNELFILLNTGGFLTTIFEIDINGSIERAIPRDYQLDPVKGHLIHIDFLRVSKDSVVTVEVPVHTINEDASPGLKNNNGVLTLAQHTISLSVPAEQIPEAIEIDLAGLEIGDSVHISQVKLPNGAKPTHHEDFAVLSVTAPKVVEEEPDAEAAPAEAEAEETPASEAE